VIDKEMQDAVRITVIATGFERSKSFSRRLNEVPLQEPQAAGQTKTENSSHSIPEEREQDYQSTRINTDDLDIPTFLRNRFRLNEDLLPSLNRPSWGAPWGEPAQDGGWFGEMGLRLS